MELRNFILIALAFDATQQECDSAHELIDRISGGVDPSLLVTATVSGTTGALVTSGSGTPAGSNSTTVDAAGFPWDARIHSSNRKMTEKGLWTMRRGCTPAQKASVEAELRKTMAATATPPANPTPTPAAPVTTASPPMPGGNLPPMPGAAQPDPAYTAFVKLIAENTQSSTNPNGAWDEKYVKDVLMHYGVAEGSLQNLAHRLDLVPEIHEWFAGLLKRA